MKHLITGSGGFLGGHLASFLLSQPSHSVHSLGLRAPDDKRLTHVECDLLDRAKVRSTIGKLKPDRIYHLAGSARVSQEIAMPEYYRSNLATTESLLEALGEQDHPVRLFLSSSVHVYGNQTGQIDENSELRPLGYYGMSKYLAERAVQNFVDSHPNAHAVVGRLYSCIGPGQSEGFVIPDLTKKLVQLPPGAPLETGPLDAFRRFLDVRDAAQIMAGLLEATPSRFEVVNIASPFEKQIREMVDLLLKASGKQVPVQSRPSENNPFKGLRLNIDKLQQILPSMQFRPLETTLKDMWSWGLLEFSTPKR